ncbi:MAG: hypothetical protein A2Y75_06065 [Candidatus Solincola sediminis]|uniref:7-cyano-7-deazaguanine synthase n=1 Tax=Candidatus Solincola sediminis TaxID=1797199 RepID=A0A1F2WFX2_9ACTN|nr:MAG: hypothetical protein A2Y75_06065 [Candidatus Solincola sediminis]
MASNLVLLSAGLDSAVNFLIAMEKGGVGAAVTVDYGQRAAAREVAKAKALCDRHGAPHIVLDAGWLAGFSKDALTTEERALPRVACSDLEDANLMQKTMRAVWVPNRNGLLVNMGAAVAEAMEVPWLVMGLNAEEAASFPDNSAGFIEEANRSLAYSTLSGVQLRSFTIDWDKARIFEEALARGLDFSLVWSCYEGGELMCGACESCARLQRVAARSGNSVRLQDFFAEN